MKTSYGAKTSSTATPSACTKARRSAAEPSKRWSAGRSPVEVSSSGQARARSRDLARYLILVGGQKRAASNHDPPVDDHGLSAGRGRERQSGDEVSDPGVREVINPEASDVGAFAALEGPAVVAAEAISAALRRQPPRGACIQRPRGGVPDAREQQGLMDLHREVGVLVAGRAVDAETDTRAGANQVLHPAGAGAQPHVARRAMGDACPDLGDAIDLGVVEVDAVGVPHVIARPAKVLHELDRPAAELLEAETLLVQGLSEVRVEAHAVAARQFG